MSRCFWASSWAERWVGARASRAGDFFDFAAAFFAGDFRADFRAGFFADFLCAGFFFADFFFADFFAPALAPFPALARVFACFLAFAAIAPPPRPRGSTEARWGQGVTPPRGSGGHRADVVPLPTHEALGLVGQQEQAAALP